MKNTEPIVDNTKSNQLIAEFMGHKYIKPEDSSDAWGWYVNGDNKYRYNYLGKLQYDSSWSWLFPVIEKIESLGYKWEIGMSATSPYHYCKIWSIGKIEGISPLDAVYGAVVEFITWYNNQSK